MSRIIDRPKIAPHDQKNIQSAFLVTYFTLSTYLLAQFIPILYPIIIILFSILYSLIHNSMFFMYPILFAFFINSNPSIFVIFPFLYYFLLHLILLFHYYNSKDEVTINKLSYFVKFGSQSHYFTLLIT